MHRLKTLTPAVEVWRWVKERALERATLLKTLWQSREGFAFLDPLLYCLGSISRDPSLGVSDPSVAMHIDYPGEPIRGFELGRDETRHELERLCRP